MIPVTDLPGAVERLGGPPEYVAENRRRLEEMARRQVALVRQG
jgi:hypothetical protein